MLQGAANEDAENPILSPPMSPRPLDLDLNLPTDIPDLPVSPVSDEAWYAEQRQVMAEHAARYTAEERLERWKRDHANDTPFVM